ncbi:MAG: tetratricopeptide repeat protein [Myxococcota bacterium]
MLLALILLGVMGGCTDCRSCEPDRSHAEPPEPPRPGPPAPDPEPPPDSALEAVWLARGPGGVHRYRLRTARPLPFAGVGRSVVLHNGPAGSPDRIAVGHGQIAAIHGATIEISASLLDDQPSDVPLYVAPMPAWPRVGKAIGAILAHDGDRGAVRINLAHRDGVRVGDLYRVLGAAHSDRDFAGSSLGRQIIGLIEVFEAPAGTASARARIIDGPVPDGAWITYLGRRREPTGPPAAVTVLITRFPGRAGRRYARALCRAMKPHARVRCAQRGRRVVGDRDSSVTVLYIDDNLALYDDAAIRQLGREHGADIVVWGDVFEYEDTGQLVLESHLTFVYPGRDSELGRVWRDTRVTIADLDGRAGIASELAGLAMSLAGTAHFRAADYTRAVYHFERAEQLGALRDARDARLSLFYGYKLLGRWDDAERVAERIRADGVSTGERWREGHGTYQLGYIAQRRGQLDPALAHFERSLAIAEDEGEEHGAAMAWSRIAEIYTVQEQLDRAMTIYRDRVLPVYRTLGDARATAMAWAGVAAIQHRREEHDQALQTLYDRVLPLIEQIGDRRELAVVWGRIADIYQDLGRVKSALHLRMHRERPGYQRVGDAVALARTDAQIAELFADKGDLDRAIDIYQRRVAPALRQLGLIGELIEAEVQLAVYHLQRDRAGDRDALERILQRARDTARQADLPDEVEAIGQLIEQIGPGAR